MTTDPLMSAILADLAAGRIDAAEAGRRIDALQGADTVRGAAGPASGTAPSSEPDEFEIHLKLVIY